MNEYSFISFDIEDNVGVIHLNRPEDGNALIPEMAEELRHVALYCDGDPEVRAVLLGAHGKMFCAGGDVKEFAWQGEKAGRYTKDITHPLHSAISQFNWMDAPVIGAINGTAAGGGFSLALAPDIAIAAASAKFTMSYTKIGVTPDGSSTYFLARMTGLRRAKEMALLNPVLSAQQAMDWGIINQVVKDEELMPTALGLAKDMARGPTAAIGETKRLLLAGATESLEAQMEQETRVIAKMAASADGLEGIRAFTEKRKPNFRGQ